MQLTNEQINVCNWIYFTVATVSFGCSIVTLYLIYLMKIRNGYLLLISSMTVFQIIYDVNFIQGIVPGYANCVIWNVFNILGGLSVSLWSNIISYVALHVIGKVRSMNIYENYTKFFIFAVVPPLILSLVSIAVIQKPTDDDQPYEYCVYNHTLFARGVYALYYWGRIITILFNFGVFFYISYRIHRMMRIVQNDELLHSLTNKSERSTMVNPLSPRPSTLPGDLSGAQSSSNKIGPYPIYAATQCVAIVALVSRMKFYPLAQAISRSGAAWNEFDYYAFDSYPSNVMAAVCSPLSGILNFLIFLAMQPRAWQTFVRFFCIPMAASSSVATSTSTTPPNLAEHLLRSATTQNSLEQAANMLSEYDEDELHLYINNEELVRPSLFSTVLSENASPSSTSVTLSESKLHQFMESDSNL